MKKTMKVKYSHHVKEKKERTGGTVMIYKGETKMDFIILTNNYVTPASNTS